MLSTIAKFINIQIDNFYSEFLIFLWLYILLILILTFSALKNGFFIPLEEGFIFKCFQPSLNSWICVQIIILTNFSFSSALKFLLTLCQVRKKKNPSKHPHVHFDHFERCCTK